MAEKPPSPNKDLWIPRSDNWVSSNRPRHLKGKSKNLDVPVPPTTDTGVQELKPSSRPIEDSLNGDIAKEFPKTAKMVLPQYQSKSQPEQLQQEVYKVLMDTLNPMKIVYTKIVAQEHRLTPPGVYDEVNTFERKIEDKKTTVANKDGVTESSTTSAISKMFKWLRLTKKAEQTEERIHKKVESIVDGVRHSEMMTQLSSMARDLQFNTLYTTNTMEVYLKKSLDLKYRHLFVARDTLSSLHTLAKSVDARLGVIEHNTYVPDDSKQRFMHMVKHTIKQKDADFVASKLLDVRNTILKKTRGSLNIGAQYAARGIMAASDAGADSVIGGLASTTIGKKVVNMANPIASGETTVGGAVKRSLNDTKKSISRAILPSWMNVEQKEDIYGVANKPKLDESVSQGVDGATRRSIVEIIPGYLAKMTKFLQDIVTEQDNEELVYDPFKKDFSTKSIFAQDVKTHVLGKKQTRGINTAKAVGSIGGAFSLKSKKAFSKFQENIAEVQRVVSNAASLGAILKPKVFETYLEEGEESGNISELFKGVPKDSRESVAIILLGAMRNSDGSNNKEIINRINSYILAQASSSPTKKVLPALLSAGYDRHLGDLLKDGKMSRTRYVSHMTSDEEQDAYDDAAMKKELKETIELLQKDPDEIDPESLAGKVEIMTRKGVTISKKAKTAITSKILESAASERPASKSKKNKAGKKGSVGKESTEKASLGEKTAAFISVVKDISSEVVKSAKKDTKKSTPKKAEKDSSSKVKEAVADLANVIGEKFNSLKASISGSKSRNLVDKDKGYVTGISSKEIGIGKVVQGAKDKARSVIDSGYATLQSGKDKVGGTHLGLDKASHGILTSVKGATKTGVSAIKDAASSSGREVREISKKLREVTSDTYTGVKDAYAGTREGITSAVGEAYESVGDVLKATGYALKSKKGKTATIRPSLKFKKIMDERKGPVFTTTSKRVTVNEDGSVEESTGPSLKSQVTTPSPKEESIPAEDKKRPTKIIDAIYEFNQNFNEYRDYRASMDSAMLDSMLKTSAIMAAGVSPDGKGDGTFSKIAKGTFNFGTKAGKTILSTYGKIYGGLFSGAGKVIQGAAHLAGKSVGPLANLAGVGLKGGAGIAGSLIGAYGQIYGGLLSGAGKAIGGIGKGIGGIVSGVFGKRKEAYTNIYLKDKVRPGRPLLTRRKQEEGVVFENGKRVKRSEDITEPIFDPETRDVLITEEDIRHGLVDVDNKPLGSNGGFGGFGKLGSLAKSGLGFLGSIGSDLFGAYGKIYGGVFKGLGSLAKGGMDLIGKLFGRSGNNKPILGKLDTIISLLSSMAGVPSSEVEEGGEGYDEGYEETTEFGSVKYAGGKSKAKAETKKRGKSKIAKFIEKKLPVGKKLGGVLADKAVKTSGSFILKTAEAVAHGKSKLGDFLADLSSGFSGRKSSIEDYILQEKPRWTSGRIGKGTDDGYITLRQDENEIDDVEEEDRFEGMRPLGKKISMSKAKRAAQRKKERARKKKLKSSGIEYDAETGLPVDPLREQFKDTIKELPVKDRTPKKFLDYFKPVKATKEQMEQSMTKKGMENLSQGGNNFMLDYIKMKAMEKGGGLVKKGSGLAKKGVATLGKKMLGEEKAAKAGQFLSKAMPGGKEAGEGSWLGNMLSTAGGFALTKGMAAVTPWLMGTALPWLGGAIGSGAGALGSAIGTGLGAASTGLSAAGTALAPLAAPAAAIAAPLAAAAGVGYLGRRHVRKSEEMMDKAVEKDQELQKKEMVLDWKKRIKKTYDQAIAKAGKDTKEAKRLESIRDSMSYLLATGNTNEVHKVFHKEFNPLAKTMIKNPELGEKIKQLSDTKIDSGDTSQDGIIYPEGNKELYKKQLDEQRAGVSTEEKPKNLKDVREKDQILSDVMGIGKDDGKFKLDTGIFKDSFDQLNIDEKKLYVAYKQAGIRNGMSEAEADKYALKEAQRGKSVSKSFDLRKYQVGPEIENKEDPFGTLTKAPLGEKMDPFAKELEQIKPMNQQVFDSSKIKKKESIPASEKMDPFNTPVSQTSFSTSSGAPQMTRSEASLKYLRDMAQSKPLDKTDKVKNSGKPELIGLSSFFDKVELKKEEPKKKKDTDSLFAKGTLGNKLKHIKDAQVAPASIIGTLQNKPTMINGVIQTKPIEAKGTVQDRPIEAKGTVQTKPTESKGTIQSKPADFARSGFDVTVQDKPSDKLPSGFESSIQEVPDTYKKLGKVKKSFWSNPISYMFGDSEPEETVQDKPSEINYDSQNKPIESKGTVQTRPKDIDGLIQSRPGGKLGTEAMDKLFSKPETPKFSIISKDYKEYEDRMKRVEDEKESSKFKTTIQEEPPVDETADTVAEYGDKQVDQLTQVNDNLNRLIQVMATNKGKKTDDTSIIDKLVTALSDKKLQDPVKDVSKKPKIPQSTNNRLSNNFIKRDESAPVINLSKSMR